MSNDPTPVVSEKTPVESDQPAANGEMPPMEDRFFCVTVITPKGEKIPIQVSIDDNVQDIKQMLSENKEVCYLTSYTLIYQNHELNDFADLNTCADLGEGSEFTMLEAEYTAICSRLHVQKLMELMNNTFEKPASLLSNLTTELRKKEKDQEKLKAPAPKQQNNSKSSKKRKKGKKGNRGRNNNQKKVATVAPKQPTITANELMENVSDSMSSLYPPERKKIHCVKSLSYSGWNPAPGNRKCKGDLAYLKLETLEDKVFHITATSNGFYVNGCTETTFSPEPASKSYFSHTLVEIFEQVSPQFKSNFKQLLDVYFTRHPFEILPIPVPDTSLMWMDKATTHTNDLHRTQNFGGVANRFADQLRDWNAEYQSCKELPKSTVQERIFRDRSIIKITNEFTNAAIDGVITIINGNILPINPTDPVAAHLYIFNNIFFSHALNGRFLFDEGEGDMGPYKLSNNDLRGVMTFNSLESTELHTVLTVIVTYQGFRMVAQSIIPGILNHSGASCIKYGTIDHGESLIWDEEFHNLMKEAATVLRIPEHEVEDGKGDKFKLNCAADSKGVLGTDGRKYVLDLDHTMARDVNFDDKWAVLRPELYSIYTDYLRHGHYVKHKELFAKRKAEEEAKKEEAKKEEGEDKKAEAEETPKIEIPEFIPPTFNPNVFSMTKGKVVGTEEEVAEAEKQVKDISAFLKDTIIPNLVNELLRDSSIPSDSGTLKQIFHHHGVNLRYMGLVAQKLGTSKPFIKDVLVREMIVRASTHILHRFLCAVGHGKLAHCISHFLNCFIRGAFMRNYNISNSSLQSNIVPQYSLSPATLWSEIEKHIEERFKYNLQKEEFIAADYITPAVRLLCQKTGIVLTCKAYDFYAHEPIHQDDIMKLKCVVKIPEHQSKDAEDLLKGGKNALIRGRVDVAFELLTEALSIFHQTYGPMHPQTGRCYSNLALILGNAVSDITHALSHQSKAIVIFERTLGLDHQETAYEYSQLASLYHKANERQLALGFLQRSYQLTTLISGKYHPDAAGVMATITTILQELGEPEAGIEFLIKASENLELHFGAKHMNCASLHHAIAVIYDELSQHRLALNYERKSYEIVSEKLGEKDPRTIASLKFQQELTAKFSDKTKETKTGNLAKAKPTPANRATDDNIGTLPIQDILKYINNSESRALKRAH